MERKMDSMGSQPIQSFFQPVTIDTMLNKKWADLMKWAKNVMCDETLIPYISFSNFLI